MTSGYILIVAILVLGGLIATLGDRIGTRVGKARLSLFNLRPRKTATLVTIITGSLIAASTLGILFGLSESLREGVFELDNILRELRRTTREVTEAKTEKNQVESELAKARSEQAAVQKRLDATNKNFQQAKTQLRDISKQANVLRSEIKSLLAERQELIQRRNQLLTERQELIGQRNQLVAERQELIGQRNQLVAERRQLIEQRDQLVAERRQLIEQRDQLNQQITQFNSQVTQLKARVAQRDEQLVKQDQAIAERDQLIAEREARFQALEQELLQREVQLAEQDKELEQREKRLAFLEQEVEVLEQYYQNYQVLRQGNLALLRGQVLAFGVVRIVEPSAANQALDRLLREANRTAIEITQSGQDPSKEPLVQISQAQAEQLIDQIKGGQDYVVRIVSAGNYVVGEKSIQVFADAAPNQLVLNAGEVLSAISVDSSTMTNREIQQRLEQLLAIAQFRARRAGILGQIQVGDGQATSIISFIEQLDEYDQALDVRAVAIEKTYTAGPLKMQLVATLNGQIIFSTKEV